MRLAPALAATLCALPAAALLLPAQPPPRPSSQKQPTRREALGGLIAAALWPAGAAVAEEEYELVVQQAALLSGLARAPARNIIVTGASSGVGLAGAKILTAAGHSVTLACRTQAKADAAARACMDYAAGATGGPATASPYGLADFAAARRSGGVARGAECNLAALSSVRSFAGSFTGPLDTLVLNAGLSLNVGDDKEQFTADGFELTVGTNHLGHFALADALLPTLAKGTKPRLVVTASGVHDPASEGGKQGGPDKWAHLGSMDGLAGGKGFTMADGGKYDPDKAYKDSKLANMLFMAEASRRYAGKVTVNAFSPGLIADPNGFFRNQNKLFANAFNGITQKAGVGETNDFAGSALAFLAVDPALEGKTAGWYDALPLGKHSLAKHAPSVEARDAAEAKRLWELSQKLVAV